MGRVELLRRALGAALIILVVGATALDLVTARAVVGNERVIILLGMGGALLGVDILREQLPITITVASGDDEADE